MEREDRKRSELGATGRPPVRRVKERNVNEREGLGLREELRVGTRRQRGSIAIATTLL